MKQNEFMKELMEERSTIAQTSSKLAEYSRLLNAANDFSFPLLEMGNSVVSEVAELQKKLKKIQAAMVKRGRARLTDDLRLRAKKKT